MPVIIPHKDASLRERILAEPHFFKLPDTIATALAADWTDLMGAIGSGRAASLSAREGHILQVRPKAASSKARTLVPGPDGPTFGLPLGFYLRSAFVAALLQGRLGEFLAG